MQSSCEGNDPQPPARVESGFLLTENYVSQRPLNEHDLAENVVSHYKARTEESIGGSFKMGGNAAEKMKMLAIDVRADESHGDLAFALIGLVLDRNNVIDGFEKLLHLLTLSTR